jgi:hypothetical protein
MTSSSEMRSRMSIVGGYSNEVAAGSRLNRWICRLSDWACAMMDAQNVDLPEPAGPKRSDQTRHSRSAQPRARPTEEVQEEAQRQLPAGRKGPRGDGPVTRMA